MSQGDPIKVIEKSVIVSNGEHNRPSTFIVHSKARTNYVNLHRCDKELLRFLRFGGGGDRQLCGLQLWSEWEDAIEAVRTDAFSAMTQEKDDGEAEEELEAQEKDDGEEEDVPVGVGRQRQLNWMKKNPFVEISLPVAPGAERKRTLKVVNNKRVLGMACSEGNFAWLRGYVKAFGGEGEPTPPPVKRHRVAPRV